MQAGGFQWKNTGCGVRGLSGPEGKKVPAL